MTKDCMMNFTIKAKITVINDKDGSILIPGAIHSYSNKLLDYLNNVPTKSLLDGSMSKAQFIVEVLKQDENVLGTFVANHFLKTHQDLSFEIPWSVKFDFMSLDIS